MGTAAQRWRSAPNDIPCRDVWPLDVVRPFTLEAYKALHDQGMLEMQFPVVFFPDSIVLTYRTGIPQEWIREALRVEEERIALDWAVAAAFPEKGKAR